MKLVKENINEDIKNLPGRSQKELDKYCVDVHFINSN